MIETNTYGASKDLVSKNEEIQCDNIIKPYKKWLILMKLQKKKKEHNPNWQQIPDHPYIILITGGSGSRKTNSLFILISQQPDI